LAIASISSRESRGLGLNAAPRDGRRAEQGASLAGSARMDAVG
jgi:hypothetical protein